MKMQNIIRMNVIGLGVAAAMLLSTAPAHAQEISNTEFSDGPYVTAYAQPSNTTTQTAQTTQATQAPATAAVANTPAISTEQLSSLAGTGDWALASGLSGIVVLIAVFAVGQYRRINRNLRPRRPLTRPVAYS
jgi:hypothetical protein